MTDQPEALRLADVLWPWREGMTNNLSLAAAELRRLHAAHEHQYAMAGLMLREAERTQRELDKVREAARMALEFCEFCWRDVSLNDYAEERRTAVENALREALGGGDD